MAKERIILAVDAMAGISQAVAKSLAGVGHTVYASMPDLCNSNKEAVHHLIEFALCRNMDLHVVRLDISSKESCRTTLDQIKLERGPISTVIGSVGMGAESALLTRAERENLSHEVRSVLSLRPDEWPICILIDPELVKITAFHKLPQLRETNQAKETKMLFDLARLAQSVLTGQVVK
jgi:NAD(P)-dependent dehydrogenase (short-subunit alcohol dehydrogenase family)